eukprot:Lankesteria_metandrocarpae@DN8299_c0_g1_i1.p1
MNELSPDPNSKEAKEAKHENKRKSLALLITDGEKIRARKTTLKTPRNASRKQSRKKSTPRVHDGAVPRIDHKRRQSRQPTSQSRSRYESKVERASDKKRSTRDGRRWQRSRRRTRNPRWESDAAPVDDTPGGGYDYGRSQHGGDSARGGQDSPGQSDGSRTKMTTGQLALLEKKQKLYNEKDALKLCGVRKMTINPIDAVDLSRFPDNAFITSRYTWWNFLPKNLYEQFHRLPNVWYITVSCLQIIPPLINNTTSWRDFDTALPLLILLGVTALKDYVEDFRKHESDRNANSRSVCKMDGCTGIFQLVEWKTLRVGNIVQLFEDCDVPADMVMLSSSTPEGIAYVQTTALDGETNLKLKVAVKGTRAEVTAHSLAAVKGRIVCEQPSSALDNFSGSLKLEAHPRAAQLDIRNFILKGSRIRNTDWIYGVVVYTGTETRLHFKASKQRAKRSVVDKAINSYVLIIFGILLLLVIISVVAGYLLSIKRYSSLDGALQGTGEESAGYETPWTFLLHFVLLYNNLVPISLMVTVDIVRFLQGYFIESDPVFMKAGVDDDRQVSRGAQKTARGGIRAQARNAALSETLGQVDFLFADKTGTLTQNSMTFAAASIGGRIYASKELSMLQSAAADIDSMESSCSSRASSRIDGHFPVGVNLRSSTFDSSEDVRPLEQRIPKGTADRSTHRVGFHEAAAPSSGEATGSRSDSFLQYEDTTGRFTMEDATFAVDGSLTPRLDRVANSHTVVAQVSTEGQPISPTDTMSLTRTVEESWDSINDNLQLFRVRAAASPNISANSAAPFVQARPMNSHPSAHGDESWVAASSCLMQRLRSEAHYHMSELPSESNGYMTSHSRNVLRSIPVHTTSSEGESILQNSDASNGSSTSRTSSSPGEVTARAVTAPTDKIPAMRFGEVFGLPSAEGSSFKEHRKKESALPSDSDFDVSDYSDWRPRQSAHSHVLCVD